MTKKIDAIWCDHCNAHILPAGVRGCVRKDCKSKAVLAQLERQRLAA